jgi:hypothetical protein
MMKYLSVIRDAGYLACEERYVFDNRLSIHTVLVPSEVC